jgi:hypothetical protein
MRKRWTWVAWSMVAIFVVACAGMAPLSVANGNLRLDVVTAYLAFAAFVAMGAVVVAHRPGNAVGWVFSAVGLLSASGGLAMEYAEYAFVTRPGSLPGATLAAWYASWWWYPLLALILVFTLLLFPTGRLLSARRRPVVMVAAIATAALTALTALPPTLTLQNEDYTVDNPIGLAGIQDPEQSTVGAALFLLFLGCMVAAVVSMVLRFRRSRGVERQQLKWFTYAGTLPILWILATEFLLPNAALLDVVFWLLMAFVPVAAGIAILRYRLYDIDRLINRTLVYGALTATLGAVYAAGVLVFGQLFGGVSRDPPTWAVAGATLAVAGLFQPAAVASRRWWIAALTGASMTLPRRSRRSAPGSVTRSTWTPCPPSCCGWSTRPCSPPPCRFGFGRRRRRHRAHKGEHPRLRYRYDLLHAMQFRVALLSQVTGRRAVQRPFPSDRDCPLHTAGDRCLWHVGGTAGENDDAPTWRRRLPARPEG